MTPLRWIPLVVALALAGCAASPSTQTTTSPGDTTSESAETAGEQESAALTAAEPVAGDVAPEEPSASSAAPGGPSATAPALASPMGEAKGAPAGGALAGTADTGEAEPVAAAELQAEPATPEPDRAGERTAAAAPTVRYLSADDSNSQASPVVARRMIREGRYVQPSTVRTYEFLNYYTFSYPPPVEGDLAIYAEMAPAKTQGSYTLQVALRSRDRGFQELAPLRLTVLVDVSGSMAGQPLELARAFLLELAGRLRPVDRLAIVACAATARVVLEPRPGGGELAAYLEKTVLPALTPSGVTDLDAGIRAAYDQAGRMYLGTSLNRVILVSDGGANAGNLSLDAVTRQAEDSDRQGIYLAGVGVGEGFNDTLMDRFTDAGRGAYLFLDTPQEIRRVLSESQIVSNLDLALKDVRLKMVMPPGWAVTEFHGEQMSAVASDVVPQYLSPGDQMIYHLEIRGPGTTSDVFTFEAEYRPLRGQVSVVKASPTVLEMLRAQRGIVKGNAVVEYAEMLKAIVWPLEENRAANLETLRAARAVVDAAAARLEDPEIEEIRGQMETYGVIVESGEQHASARDRDSGDAAAVLGIPVSAVRGRAELRGPAPQVAMVALERLGTSARLVPLEGYAYLAIANGPVANTQHEGGGQLAEQTFQNPVPEYLGEVRSRGDPQPVYDLHQLTLTLVAPAGARSFSFDFNFFSAEYPDYVNQSFNDTFYAILRAPSTNDGRPTNIAFDAAGASIEVDNNYFQKPFHPIPNTGTGFDRNGSTGWLRTSWPIRGGERFTLTWTVHDEGDAVFDSLVLLDNFRFHEYPAVGATDPLN